MPELVFRRRTIWLPIWAMFQAFPLALFTAALVMDIAYVNTAEMQWANFAVWLIAGGLFMGGFALTAAAIAAAVSWRAITWRRGLVFGLGSLAMWAVAFANALVHSRDAWTSVMPLGLALSALTVLLALITSWIGHVDSADRVTP